MKPPTAEQKRFQREQARKAIDRICEAWPLAMEAASSRGYPSGSIGGSGRSTSVPDPTGGAAARSDRASRWLFQVQRFVGGSPIGRREEILDGVDELIENWPPNTEGVLDKLVELANTAAKEWPKTPRKGDVIDGVKIGERSETGETCSKCNRYIAGGAADPIARIDGKPYHRTPCYNTVKRRESRRRVHKLKSVHT